MQDSFLTEAFFPIIRAGLGLQSSVTVQEELDYERIIELAYLFSSHAEVEEISTWQNDEKQISK